MKKYTELWEVILHEITIPLGKYAVAYDIGAIADELIVLVDAATEQSGYALDPLTLNPGPKKSAKKPATAAERKKTTKTPRKRTTKSQRTIKKTINTKSALISNPKMIQKFRSTTSNYTEHNKSLRSAKNETPMKWSSKPPSPQPSPNQR